MSRTISFSSRRTVLCGTRRYLGGLISILGSKAAGRTVRLRFAVFRARLQIGQLTACGCFATPFDYGLVMFIVLWHIICGDDEKQLHSNSII